MDRPLSAGVTMNIKLCYARTDGSFSKSVDLGWVIAGYDIGAGPNIATGVRTLGTRQTGFEAGVAAALKWLGSKPRCGA
jgi:hypothetical protein